MPYQTIQHNRTSTKDVQLQFISHFKRLSRKVLITASVAVSHRKWFSCVSLVTLAGASVISGCSSEHSAGTGEQSQQDKESAVNKPMHKEVGEASWYGPEFQGQETSNGETYNKNEMTAAHPSLPMGTKAKVTNLENGKSVNVRINDRGPFAGNRAIDLSSAAANKLDMKKDGTAEVKIETKHVKKKSSARKSSKKKLGAKQAASLN
jgi:rare lipoprotein A (peptidoglycan hydrolase)